MDMAPGMILLFMMGSYLIGGCVIDAPAFLLNLFLTVRLGWLSGVVK